MKAYIVRGTHWSVPGVPCGVHLDPGTAEDAARQLVQLLAHESHDIEGQVVTLLPGADWRIALRQLQEARVLWLSDRSIVDGMSDEDLIATAECDVWIEEHEVAAGPDGPWAFPISHRTLDLYRALADTMSEVMDGIREGMQSERGKEDWGQVISLVDRIRLADPAERPAADNAEAKR